MSANEWKVKYYELKNKWMDSVDRAYRLGFEQGAKETQMEMQAQQMQQQMEMQAAMQAQQQGAPVDEQGNPIPPEELPPEMQEAMAAEQGGEEGFVPPPEDVDPEKAQELDAYIQELESLVAKGEKPSIKDMRKAVESISEIRKSQKNKWVKKVKKDTSAQKKIVDGILAKWDEESKDLTEELEESIKKQGLEIEG